MGKQGDGQKTLLTTEPVTAAGEEKEVEKTEEPQTVAEKLTEEGKETFEEVKEKFEDVKEKIGEVAETVKDAVMGSDDKADATVDTQTVEKVEMVSTEQLPDPIVEQDSVPKKAPWSLWCWAP